MKTAKALALLIVLFLFSATACAEESTLNADKISYDPAAQIVRAEGNVKVKRADGAELTGAKGSGNTDGTTFSIEGGVKGKFPKESVTLDCDKLVLTREGANRTILGNGSVALTRSADKLNADSVKWRLDSDNYRANGNVDGSFESHAIQANEVARDREIFWGKGVRRYEDKKRGFSLTAQTVSGRLNSKSNEVIELIAEGGLVMNMRDKEGKPIRITGKKAVYSRARGTIVVTGNAVATQQGRTVKAGSLVYEVDSQRIEALDSPQIVFDLDSGK